MQSNLFSFDIGTNSIGWCVFGLNSKGEPDRIVDMGTRIFADGREPAKKGGRGEPLAKKRREARGASRMARSLQTPSQGHVANAD